MALNLVGKNVCLRILTPEKDIEQQPKKNQILFYFQEKKN